MIELTNTAVQTIQPGQSALFNTVVSKTGCDTCHRCGSGQVQLKGHGTCCNPARYKLVLSGNLGGAAATQPSIALALNGETLYETIRTVTTVADTDVFAFAAETNVRECGECCDTITVRNVGTTPITLSNPSFIVARTA